MPYLFNEDHGGVNIGNMNFLEISLLRPRLVSDQLSDQLTNQVSNVTSSFTNWDKCMIQIYCKWPAIIGLVIGGLIVLSIIICMTRCLCFGYSFCCSCFSFLSCCGCCRSCCSGKRRKSIAYKNHSSSDYRNQGYSAPPPMMKGGINNSQSARFSIYKAKSRPVNEDSLPAMPSWDTATSVHVLDEAEDSESVELEQMNSSIGQKTPLVTAAAVTGTSSPLGQENVLAPFKTRQSPNNNNSYINPNTSNLNRSNENLIDQYSSNPSIENGARFGGSSSSLNGIGYGIPGQRPYNEGIRSTPMRAPYQESGRSSPMQAPYPGNGRSSPMLAPYPGNGRSSPMQAPYPGNGRLTPTQAPYPDNGRSSPMQAPYQENGRSANPYNQNRFGSPIPGGRSQMNKYNPPLQGQRPPMGYQGY
ncbi:hypothetical protein HI914_04474 [Erysiphe necator]|nr:hypothetical protein HI914_04474 [Erysiphe necator]